MTHVDPDSGIQTAVELPEGPAREVFTSSPQTEMIFKIARKAQVSPEALLGTALAEVIGHTAPHVVLPPMVGTFASLNLGILNVGPSGAGKSAAAKVARTNLRIGPELSGFPDSTNVSRPGVKLERRGISSGEGISAVFDQAPYAELERKIQDAGKNPDAGGKLPASAEHLRPPDRVFFWTDEVSGLEAQKSRSGSSTLTTMTLALMGEDLGTSGAVKETQRSIPAMSYRSVFGVGVQPEKAGWLIGEATSGLPQRFVWLDACDRYTPEFDYVYDEADNVYEDYESEELAIPTLHIGLPAELCERRDLPEGAEHWTDDVAADDRIVMRFPRAVRRKVQSDRSKVKTGKLSMSAHRNLVQMRCAAGFALLRGESYVTMEDWRTAGYLLQVSDTVIESCRAATREAAQVVADEEETRRADARAGAKQHRVEWAEQQIRMVALGGDKWSGRGGAKNGTMWRRHRDIRDEVFVSMIRDRKVLLYADHLYLPENAPQAALDALATVEAGENRTTGKSAQIPAAPQPFAAGNVPAGTNVFAQQGAAPAAPAAAPVTEAAAPAEADTPAQAAVAEADQTTPKPKYVKPTEAQAKANFAAWKAANPPRPMPPVPTPAEMAANLAMVPVLTAEALDQPPVAAPVEGEAGLQ